MKSQQVSLRRAYSPKQMEIHMITHTHTHALTYIHGEIRAARLSKYTTCAARIIPFKDKPREQRSTSHKKLQQWEAPEEHFFSSHNGVPFSHAPSMGQPHTLHTLASPLKVLIAGDILSSRIKSPYLLGD